MNNRKNRVTVKSVSSSRYFFIRPAPRTDSGELAERILENGNVNEVLLVEGDYGLIVKAAENDSEISDYINRNFKGNYGKAVCHYRYVR